MAASLFEKLSEIFISTVKAEEEEEEEEEEVKKTIWIIFNRQGAGVIKCIFALPKAWTRNKAK